MASNMHNDYSMAIILFVFNSLMNYTLATTPYPVARFHKTNLFIAIKVCQVVLPPVYRLHVAAVCSYDGHTPR